MNLVELIKYKSISLLNLFNYTYVGMVTCMDEEIGNIVDVLKQRNIWKDTVLIFSTGNICAIIKSVKYLKILKFYQNETMKF